MRKNYIRYVRDDVDSTYKSAVDSIDRIISMLNETKPLLKEANDDRDENLAYNALAYFNKAQRSMDYAEDCIKAFDSELEDLED